MRNAFADEITKLAQSDERIVLLSGDIGNRLFDTFKEKCPGRFHNCGVAEANMIGMAAGMALAGMRPVCYTITPFVTYRCMEQIRVDVCYHDLPVMIVGTGAGLAYASLGATHHSCEEVGMLRLLPNMSVLAPADPMEVRSCLRAAMAHDHATYMRIGKKGEASIHPEPPVWSIGSNQVMHEGKDVSLLVAGVLLPAALAAAELLALDGISAEVVTCPTIKPLDGALMKRVFGSRQIVATLEEHSVLGGFGGAVAEWRSDEAPLGARLLRFGTPDEFLHETCEQEHAHEKFGLTGPAVAARIRESFQAR